MPPISGRIPVEACIVKDGQARWVSAMAHAWSSKSVCIWWSDTDHLQRIDWVAPHDVRRGTANMA